MQSRDATDNRASVAVTGLGLVTPLGTSAEENWGGFLRGESGIRTVTHFDARRYPSALGGQIDRGHLRRLFHHGATGRHDPATLLLLAAAGEALEQGGFVAGRIPEERRSLIALGSTLGGMEGATAYVRERAARGEGRARASLLREMLAQSQAYVLAEEWGLRGATLILSDACASGTSAIGAAYRSLRAGTADLAVAGGYDPLTEFVFAGFHSLMAIGPEPSRPFDRDRRGLLLGEGAAIFVLEREADARARGATILGRVAGFGESADAFHITRPDPEARGAALALRRALDDARIAPEDVGHINAHGTGTPSNDPMEAKAIRTVFGDRAARVPVTSNKAAIGHTLGASGAVEAAITLLTIRDQVVPPTLHHENLDPECAGLDVVSGEPRHATIRHAVSNSFGFGGSNAAVVLSQA